MTMTPAFHPGVQPAIVCCSSSWILLTWVNCGNWQPRVAVFFSWWLPLTRTKICLSLPSQVRLKAAPALVLLLLALLRLSGLHDSSAALASYSYGALSGWVYLRFYQRHSRGRGDMSDHFAFASFFPEALQPAVGLLAGLVHAALVKIKVCRKMVKRYDVGAPSSITISLPGTDPQDAERRRWVRAKKNLKHLHLHAYMLIHWSHVKACLIYCCLLYHEISNTGQLESNQLIFWQNLSDLLGEIQQLNCD